MSMRPQAIPPVPEETARVARLLLPKGNRSLLLREELGSLYQDAQFQPLFPRLGQAARGTLEIGPGQRAALYGELHRSAGC